MVKFALMDRKFKNLLALLPKEESEALKTRLKGKDTKEALKALTKYYGEKDRRFLS